MSPLTKADLRRINFDDGISAPGEQTAQSATTLTIIDEESERQITEVFGLGIMEDRDKVQAILRTRRELTEEGTKALHAAINMGRSLLDLQHALTPDEFRMCREHASTLFPGFSKGNVNKLMAVAEGWEKGAFPAALASPHYTVLYEFTTIEGGVEQALADRVFRPDVTRKEVVEWKRGVKVSSRRQKRASPKAAPLSRLLSERDRLRERLTILEAEREQIYNRIVEISEAVGDRHNRVAGRAR